MALITKIILYFTFTAFFFGQLFRLNFLNFSFPVFDIFLPILAIINIINHRLFFKKFSSPIILFCLFSLLSLIFNWFRFPFSFSSFFYWLRLSSLLSFFLFPLSFNTQSQKFFHLILWADLIFAFIQYFLWPDFTYFSALNWDPHLYRLLGTFFDPTFTALIFLFFLLKIYFSSSSKLYLIPIYLGMALTYSRSTLLAFIIVFAFISFKKKNIKIFFISLLILISTIILLPRMPGEGTKLERTSSIKAKIVNYQQGIKLFLVSPLIGVGYNNLPVVRENQTSHSVSGFDSSLLTIAITTGIIGLILFLDVFWSTIPGSSLYWQSLLLAIFIHSLFANSLLYPFTLFFLVLEFKYRK